MNRYFPLILLFPFLLLSAACQKDPNSILRIQTEEGAQIYVDGEFKAEHTEGVSTLNVVDGERQVLVIKKGQEPNRYFVAQETITLGPDVVIKRTLSLSPAFGTLEDGEFEPGGKLLIRSEPSNVPVLVDGEPVGKTPLDLDVLPGKRTVELKDERLKENHQWEPVDVPSGQTVELLAEVEWTEAVQAKLELEAKKRREDEKRKQLLRRSTQFGARKPNLRYSVTSDTVYDKVTKLTWTRKVVGGKTGPSDIHDRCRNLKLRGNSSWYVPDLEYLSGLYDERSNINKYAFPGFPVSTRGIWSADSRLDVFDNPQYYAFSFAYGKKVSTSYPARSRYLLCYSPAK